MKTKTLKSTVLAVMLVAVVAINVGSVAQWRSHFTEHNYGAPAAILVADGPEEIPPAAILVADGPEEIPPAAILVADGPEEIPPVLTRRAA